MLEMLGFAALYIVLICVFLFIMLFGECSFFEDTVVSKAHAFLTGGLCEAGSNAVERYCGERGKRCVGAATTQCCDRPNPALQLMYLGLVTAGYFVFLRDAAPLLPGPYASDVHLWTGPAAVTSGLVFFLLTCFSDPGTVHAGNVDRHLDSFAYDGLLYAPKRCPTMRLQAPARSKFCRVTNRRVARFDHFCSWMNNSIGENNYRYFLGFLLWHVVLCAYGATLMIAIIAGEARVCAARSVPLSMQLTSISPQLTQRGVLDVHVEGRNGREIPAREAPLAVLQWVIYHYLSVAMLAFFLSLTTVLVFSFSMYHMWLTLSNETTNESWKRKEMRKWLICEAIEEAEDKAAAAAAQPGAAAVEQALPPLHQGFLARLLRRKPKAPPASGALSAEVLADIDARCRNIYDRGPWLNLLEVLFPRSQRRRRAEPAAAAAVPRRKKKN